MPRMPKDYSRHQNKIVGNLSIKALLSIVGTGFLLLLLFKSSLFMIFKIILGIPLLIIGLLCAFYKNAEGDDFATYIFNALIYYSSPKNLVYKKKNNSEGD